MGVTYLTIKIVHPKNDRSFFERKILVDSGAIFSVIPASDLNKLGVKPDTKQKFILANGAEIEKEVGEVKFIYKEFARTAPVVFGDEGVYLLGATALEAMGLILDPVNRTLRKLPMIL